MPRVLAVVILIALTIYCTVEVAQARPLEVRRMPKWMWVVVVIFLPGIGPLAWLLFGRPLPGGGAGGNRFDQRPPDDDPDFLASL